MKIKTILKSIWNEFIYGGHLQSLGASAVIFVSCFLSNIKFSWDIFLVSYLVFYSLYLYNYYKEIEIDKFTNYQRTEYLKKYIKNAPLIIFLIFLVVSLLVFIFGKFSGFIFVFLIFLFGFLYSFVFKRVTKRVPLFKNFYVSAFFSAMVFLPKVYYSVPILVLPTLVLAIFIFLKAFLMQILLDLKDVETDKKMGLLTLPSLLGEKRTITVLKIFSFLLTSIFLIIFCVFLHLFPPNVLVWLFGIPFNFLCYYLAEKKDYTAYILGSGEFFLLGVLILITLI